MLIDLLPQAHARLTALPLLGPELDGLARWLSAQGLPPAAIRKRVRKATVLDARLQADGLRQLRTVSRTRLLACAPPRARDEEALSALVRSLTSYLDARGAWPAPAPTPSECLLDRYRDFLQRVRGCAASTVRNHARTVRELLAALAFDTDPAALQKLAAPQLEAFLKALAERCGQGSLQHAAANLRCFLRFLANHNEVPTGLDTHIDAPCVYRGERLPRAVPWETVQAFLAGIGRTTATGRRDYAMCLLMATYGLRASEVAALQLDSIRWRTGELRAPCPKGRTEHLLPLTADAGNAVLGYLRNGRPTSPLRDLFLGCRQPLRALTSAGVQSAFRRCTMRSAADMPVTGPHCLRHSLAVHLLRQAQPLHAIGALLGHGSVESTGTYLRLHEEDLRTAALDLPAAPEASS